MKKKKYQHKNPMTSQWEDLLDRYFYEKRLKPDTEDTYRKVVRLALIYFSEEEGRSVSPDELTRNDLLHWRRHELNVKKVSDRTWNTKVRHLQSLYNFWVKKHWVTQIENPCYECQVIPGTKRKKCLSESQLRTIYRMMEQFKKLSTELPTEQVTYRSCALFPTYFWLTVLETLRLTAMRLNQLVHVRVKDIDFERSEINLIREGSKSHREYPVVMLDGLKPLLKSLIEEMRSRGITDDEPLFNVYLLSDRLEDQKKPINPMTIRAFFRRLSGECGFAVSSHRFRHTLGTTLMRIPERNLELTKNMLGHRSLVSTMEYIGQDTSRMKAILEYELRDYLKMGLGGEHDRLLEDVKKKK
ncbi:site-specific integrase [Morganella morganii]|nr:site-specific integrase [Morganella morganii]